MQYRLLLKLALPYFGVAYLFWKAYAEWSGTWLTWAILALVVTVVIELAVLFLIAVGRSIQAEEMRNTALYG